MGRKEEARAGGSRPLCSLALASSSPLGPLMSPHGRVVPTGCGRGLGRCCLQPGAPLSSSSKELAPSSYSSSLSHTDEEEEEFIEEEEDQEEEESTERKEEGKKVLHHHAFIHSFSHSTTRNPDCGQRAVLDPGDDANMW